MEWCSDLNPPSITVANLVGSWNVIKRVTSVGSMVQRYLVTVKDPLGVGVTVTSQVFDISLKVSKGLRIDLEAREVTNGYSFRELVLTSDRKHVVRIPMAILVTSTLKP